MSPEAVIIKNGKPKRICWDGKSQLMRRGDNNDVLWVPEDVFERVYKMVGKNALLVSVTGDDKGRVNYSLREFKGLGIRPLIVEENPGVFAGRHKDPWADLSETEGGAGVTKRPRKRN